MEQLAKHRDWSQTKHWQFQQKWQIIEQSIGAQANERSSDIDQLKEMIEYRLAQNQEYQTTKLNLINQNITRLWKQASSCKQNIDQSIDIANNYAEECSIKKNYISQDLNDDVDAVNSNILTNSNKKAHDLASKIQTINAKKIQKTQEVMADIKQNYIDTLKNFMQTQKEKLKNSFQELNSNTCKELQKMKDKVREYTKKKDQSQMKLKAMINTLNIELGKAFNDQVKEGEIVYDSLLKLIQDSCSKIQQIQYK